MNLLSMLPEMLKIRLSPNPVSLKKCAQGLGLTCQGPNYALRRLRPLARRLASTFRPDLVEFLLRKPNLRARRIFEGL